MARSDGFSGLSEFLAVARHSSFRAAAAELGVTPAAVSQAIRTLETKTGLLLFQRTTRRVGLTEAGERLLARIRPAAAEIADAFEALAEMRSRPTGLLRLSVPRVALPLVIEPVLPEFRRAYPDVAVDIDVNDAAVDLTAHNLDAGIRIGESVERDMIAVRLTPDVRWSVLGSPAYFAARGRPRTPEDLTRHECIRYRFLTARAVYRWEFVRGSREFSVDASGSVTVNDGALMIVLARAGMGLIYTADLFAARELRAGELQPVLESFLPSSPGLFLYFPARTQMQPKLRAFIDAATLTSKRRAQRATARRRGARG
ncbi:MAG TPA: LysR substrate-binding domain-containing protein [Polyangiaceae bacterium]